MSRVLRSWLYWCIRRRQGVIGGKDRGYLRYGVQGFRVGDCSIPLHCITTRCPRACAGVLYAIACLQWRGLRVRRCRLAWWLHRYGRRCAGQAGAPARDCGPCGRKPRAAQDAGDASWARTGSAHLVFGRHVATVAGVVSCGSNCAVPSVSHEGDVPEGLHRNSSGNGEALCAIQRGCMSADAWQRCDGEVSCGPGQAGWHSCPTSFHRCFMCVSQPRDWKMRIIPVVRQLSGNVDRIV